MGIEPLLPYLISITFSTLYSVKYETSFYNTDSFLKIYLHMDRGA